MNVYHMPLFTMDKFPEEKYCFWFLPIKWGNVMNYEKQTTTKDFLDEHDELTDPINKLHQL